MNKIEVQNNKIKRSNSLSKLNERFNEF